MTTKTTWHGCYDDSWKGEIVEEAFAHPAKMARGLVRRIFDHLLATGRLKRGDTVIRKLRLHPRTTRRHETRQTRRRAGVSMAGEARNQPGQGDENTGKSSRGDDKAPLNSRPGHEIVGKSSRGHILRVGPPLGAYRGHGRGMGGRVGHGQHGPVSSLGDVLGDVAG